MDSKTHLFRYESPLGPIALELAGDVCHRLQLEDVDAPECPPDHPVALWLRAYFLGKNLALPEIAPAKTAFQERLRKELLAIPFGEVHTYADLAKALDSAPRAVGQALGANPLPVLFPCHRVVASHGLGGFSCGIEWKKKLLELEGAI